MAESNVIEEKTYKYNIKQLEKQITDLRLKLSK